MDHPKSCLTAAALFSITSLGALLIGISLMFNDLANLQFELTQKSQTYMDMSNTMWSNVMEQQKLIRKDQAFVRQRRQYAGVPAGGGASSQENECLQGPKGPPGYPGEPGQDGIPGIPGGSGSSGNRFEQVSAGGYESEAAVPAPVSGAQCVPCPGGPPGPPGYKGKRGIRGEKGPQGESGPPGRNGQQGEEGPEGEIGLQGETGETGERGPPGESGIGYAKGAPGPKGETGQPGEQGEEGPPGERGEDSSPGPPGLPGPQGPPGLQGPLGNQGLPGPTGPPGAPAEYCPCPERSNGQPAGKAAYPGGIAPVSPQAAIPPGAAFVGQRFVAYNKLAHVAALRRTRHHHRL